VRFKDEDEEIDPIQSLKWVSVPEHRQSVGTEELSPEAHEQIRNLAMTLQKSRIQENRMANFAYEPVSMPPSRVCSPNSADGHGSKLTLYSKRREIVMPQVLLVRLIEEPMAPCLRLCNLHP
jgi:hypothetical protein